MKKNIVFILIVCLSTLPVMGSVSPHWTFNPGVLELDMELFFMLKQDGHDVDILENYEVAAFAGDECRGVAEVISVGGTDLQIYSLRIYGKSNNEVITFKGFNRDGNREFTILQTVSFQNNSILGTASLPFVLSEKINITPEPGTDIIYISPDGSSSGASVSSPAGDLQQAIDEAYRLGGGTIKLLPGTYSYVNTIILRHGVNIEGENTATVILNGENRKRFFQVAEITGSITGKKTYLKNLTIKNGKVSGDGGAVLLDSYFYMEKCLLIDNHASGKGGAVQGGHLDYCTLIRNRADIGGGAVSGSTVSNSVLWNNGINPVFGDYVLNYSAIDAVPESLNGEFLLYLSESNDADGDKRYAPCFASIETGSESWLPTEKSPFLKLSKNNSDQGAFQCSHKGVLKTSIVLPETFIYGNQIVPQVTTLNLYEQKASASVVLLYRAVGEIEWSEVQPSNVGKYQLKATVAATDVNWISKEETEEISVFEITPRLLTVTVNPVSKVYGDADPELSYTLSSTLLPGNELSGRLVRESGEDCREYVVRGEGLAAGNNYRLVLANDHRFVITKRPVTLEAEDATKVYGYSDPEFSVMLTEGSLVFQDEIKGYPLRRVGENVGVYPIEKGSIEISDNYEINFKPGSFSITKRPIDIVVEDTWKQFGSPDPVLTYQLSEELIGESKVTGVLVRETGEALGNYVISQGTLTLGGNYDIHLKPGIFTIANAELKVVVNEVSKTYGDPDPQFTYSVILPSGVHLTGELSREPGENTGSYTINRGSLKTADANYALVVVPAKLQITPRPITVMANPVSKIYGEEDPSLTYILSESLSENISLSCDLVREAGEHVGRYKITAKNLSSSSLNYELNFQGADFTISPRTIWVKALGATKIYGDADPELNYTYTGNLFSGDLFQGKLLRQEGEEVGQYPILIGTLNISNDYKIVLEQNTLSIFPRLLDIKLDNSHKVYGSADPKLTFSAEGLLPGENLSGSPQRQLGEDVGEYAIGIGTLSCSGNYKINTFSPAIFSIVQAEADIEIMNLEQVFDRKPKEISVSTVPEGLKYKVTYDSQETPPVDVGEYQVEVSILDKNYKGSNKAVLKILEPILDDLEYTKVITRDASGESRFVITYDEFMKDTQLKFFNSRGKVIYEKQDYLNGDFVMSGLPVGTYYFVYSYKDQQNINKQVKGFVEVVE